MRSTLKCDIISPKDLWGNIMKKKIIYISGADTFNVDDVKSAFEEVRSALKLDRDVLLFGVPVDDFEAAVQAQETTLTDATADSVDQKQIVETPVVECETTVVCEAVPEEPVKPTKKSSSRKSKAKAQQVVEEVASTEETETAKLTESPETHDETPVPILSVLAVNNQTDEQEETLGEEAIDFEDDTDQDEQDEVQDFQDEVETEEAVEDDTHIEIEDVNENMLNDEMPSNPKEKTFEDLLDITKPLCEDVQPEQPAEEDITETTTEDETDEVLKSLANEFADNQDNFLPSKKSSGHGISRLKRVLPFGKPKREDPGIMGDLFGWAGIAANDEEFSMPGFFTNVASKK